MHFSCAYHHFNGAYRRLSSRVLWGKTRTRKHCGSDEGLWGSIDLLLLWCHLSFHFLLVGLYYMRKLALRTCFLCCILLVHMLYHPHVVLSMMSFSHISSFVVFSTHLHFSTFSIKTLSFSFFSETTFLYVVLMVVFLRLCRSVPFKTLEYPCEKGVKNKTEKTRKKRLRPVGN